MDTKSSNTLSPPPPPPPPPPPLKPTKKDRDFLLHLEAYLAKRDGVDKLLKISRYTTKLLLSSSLLPTHSHSLPLTRRLKSFESSVGLSRKAFRLGKFIQDVNALRSTPHRNPLLSLLAYGGEGLYYFMEQFIWLTKSGLIDPRHARQLQRVSAWAELVGYIGSVSLKVGDLRELEKKRACLVLSTEMEESVREKERVVGEKILLKKLSILQDLADGLMALADIRDGKGVMTGPFLLSCAGLLSALISTHKNWVSC